MQKVCRTFLSIDEEIGRVAAELKDQGRFDNTIWLMTGDNGWGGGSHRWLKKNAPYTTEIPLYVSWPAGRGTDPGQVDFPVTNVDFAPTLCEFAGCEMGPYFDGYDAPDGQSFAGLIAPSLSTSIPTRTAIVTEHTSATRIPIWMSIQTTPTNPLGLWHFVYYPTTGEKELYDISNGPCLYWHAGMSGDPCELVNKANWLVNAELVDELNAELFSLWFSSGSTD